MCLKGLTHWDIFVMNDDDALGTVDALKLRRTDTKERWF